MNPSRTVSYRLAHRIYMYYIYVECVLILARTGHRFVHKCEHPENEALVVRWEAHTGI